MFLDSFVISTIVGWYNLSLHDWYSCSAGLNYIGSLCSWDLLIYLKDILYSCLGIVNHSMCHSVFISCFVAQYFLPSKWVPEAHWSWWWKKAVSVVWHIVSVGIINCYYYHYIIIVSRTLKVTGNHVMYDRSAWILRVIMSSLHTLWCLLSVKKQKHEISYFLVQYIIKQLHIVKQLLSKQLLPPYSSSVCLSLLFLPVLSGHPWTETKPHDIFCCILCLKCDSSSL